MRKWIYFGAAVVFLVASTAAARKVEHVTKRIDIEDADRLVVSCELGAGEFRITPDDISEAAVIDISYNPRRIDCIIDYSVRRGTGYLDLESSHRRKSHLDTEDNIWDITLSTKYPTAIDIDIGACDADFDFGGIPLTELTIDIGAASGVIDFSEPNPERLEEINVDCGASSLEMHYIGNANFESFSFSGGAGSFDLDFRGKYQGETTIEIEIGLGSADIVLPLGVPIRVETEGSNWLSSVDFHDDDLREVDDDIYESPDFEDADNRIILELEVGLGSVDFYWK